MRRIDHSRVNGGVMFGVVNERVKAEKTVTDRRKFCPSLPLDRAWRLGRDIVDDTVDAFYFVDDPAGDTGE
jgi:hypothetical protein